MLKVEIDQLTDTQRSGKHISYGIVSEQKGLFYDTNLFK